MRVSARGALSSAQHKSRGSGEGGGEEREREVTERGRGKRCWSSIGERKSEATPPGHCWQRAIGGSWASHCQTRFFHFPLRDVRSHFRYRKSELGVRSFVSVSFTLQSLLLLLVVVVVVVVVGVLSNLTRYTEFLCMLVWECGLCLRACACMCV